MNVTWLGYAAAVLALLGLGQAMFGWWLAVRFVAAPQAAPGQRIPVTVLKPLYGDEPMLEQALSSHCWQNDWPCQIVFGLHSHTDPALAVVKRVQARFPNADIEVVINPAQHGPNGKVSNLINMLPAAKYDVLVIADSDVHVRPDYLERLVAALEQPDSGLVTTLYAGLPGVSAPGQKPCLTGRLGAIAITHYFLPGALLARAMGRQDCLGATMALRRDTLAAIGGLEALVQHLADDYTLGRLVQGIGLHVRIAATVPATTVPETNFRALYRHELRWARTIRALEPAAFAASILQYPMVWAALAAILSAGASWAVSLFLFVWFLRVMAARGISHALIPLMPGLAFPASFWLLPLRELMSVLVMIASYGGDRVDWRGHTLHADGPVSLSNPPAPES